MIKAIFIDIDGTLRNSKKEITNKTKETIGVVKKAGIKVVICSGRARKYAECVSKECNASELIIASDGADVYDYKNNKSIYINSIPTKSCIELYKLATKHNVTICIDTENGQFTNQEKLLGDTVQYDNDIENTVMNSQIIHIHFFDKDVNKMKKVLEDVRKIEGIKIGNNDLFYNQVNYYIFVSNSNSNKGQGITKLCKKINIELKDTIAIGDDFNDLDMFKVVGHSVAMENASENIKKVVDEITLSNDEDGVAIFLDKLLKEIK